MDKFFKMLFTRLQNRNVILSIFSGVMLILTSSGVINVDHANHIDAIVNTILTALVAVGVISNPESHVQQVQDPQPPAQQ